MNKRKSAKKLSMFRIGAARKRGEGLRIGTTRYLPRGVRKKDYQRLDHFDVWLPILSPSRELLGWLREQEFTPRIGKQFFNRYKRELMDNTEVLFGAQSLHRIHGRGPLRREVTRG